MFASHGLVSPPSPKKEKNIRVKCAYREKERQFSKGSEWRKGGKKHDDKAYSIG